MTAPSTQQAPGADGQDRQRARAERGLKSTRSSSTAGRDRLPAPPRRRRPALAALAVLLIVGGATLAALLALRLDQRVPVMMARDDIAVGQQIEPSDLVETDVASDGLSLVPQDQVEAVIGTYARVAISRGQLLDTSMLTTAAPMGNGLATVGVPLVPGRTPEDLQSGDKVRVVRIGSGTSPTQPLTEAVVTETQQTAGDSLTGGTSSATGTLLVPVEAADAVVDAAGNDAVGLALVQRGVALDKVEIAPLLAEGPS